MWEALWYALSASDRETRVRSCVAPWLATRLICSPILWAFAVSWEHRTQEMTGGSRKNRDNGNTRLLPGLSFPDPTRRCEDISAAVVESAEYAGESISNKASPSLELWVRLLSRRRISSMRACRRVRDGFSISDKKARKLECRSLVKTCGFRAAITSFCSSSEFFDELRLEDVGRILRQYSTNGTISCGRAPDCRIFATAASAGTSSHTLGGECDCGLVEIRFPSTAVEILRPCKLEIWEWHWAACNPGDCIWTLNSHKPLLHLRRGRSSIDMANRHHQRQRQRAQCPDSWWRRGLRPPLRCPWRNFGFGARNQTLQGTQT